MNSHIVECVLFIVYSIKIIIKIIPKRGVKFQILQIERERKNYNAQQEKKGLFSFLLILLLFLYREMNFFYVFFLQVRKCLVDDALIQFIL